MPRPRKWTKEKVRSEIFRLQRRLGRRPVKRDDNLLYSITRKFYGSWNNAMRACGYKVQKPQSISKLPKIDENFSYLIGIIATDGHMQEAVSFGGSHKYTIMISTSYNDERVILTKLIMTLFNYEPLLRKRKYGWNVRTNYLLHVSSKRLLYFLKNEIGIPAGRKSKTIRVPKMFFKTSRKNLAGFLRGVIDGDGSIKTSHRGAVSISSGSRMFLYDIRKLMIQIRIRPSRICIDKRGVYSLNITNMESLMRLYNLLYPARFYYPRKKQAFDNIYKSINI